MIGENVVDEIQMSRTAEFEDEDEVRRLGVAKTGMLGDVIEDLFGEERIRLRSYELLDPGRRPEWGFRVPL